MMPAPSPSRAIWLMAKMRLTRQTNQIVNNLFRRLKKKKPQKTRTGFAKRSSLWILTLFMALLMSFSFLQIGRSAILNMHCHLSAGVDCQRINHNGDTHLDMQVAADQLHAAPFTPALVNGLTMELSVLFMISVLLPLGSKELAQPDWDLEWLVTLPVQRSTLLWGRLLERSASNVAGIFALMPAYTIIAWYSGFRWNAPLIALLCTAALLPLAALVHTLIDTGLRMWLPASQLRNLQALTSLFSMPFMYFVMALGMPQASAFAMEWARGFPGWMAWTPPGLLMQAIQAQGTAQLAATIALLLVQAALLMLGGVALMRYQLRNGVVSSGSRESVRRKPAAAAAVSAAEGSPRVSLWSAATASLLSPIKRRELRLLSRDRNFLVQTLLLPVIIVGSQMVFQGKLNSLPELGQHHTLAAAIAFGIGVYVLMLSAFQTLNNEGQVLWLLYTVPRSIESVLKEKAQLWGVLALFYPLVVFGISAWFTTRFDWQMLVLFLIVMAGIPIYSVIAVSLGVFGCDPQAPDVRQRIRPTYVYLYMLLASFYSYSVYANHWSQKLVVMVLTASLALALWQKSRDALPYLLDPGASPGARVSTSDGLIAATMFFVLQSVVMVFLADGPKDVNIQIVTIAFAIAGATVYVLTRLVYWRSKTAGVPAILRGSDLRQSLRNGVVMGAVALSAGLAYLIALRYSALWPLAAQAIARAAGKHVWVFGLAVVAAPLFEEFIFRGLIFGGMRRSMGAAPAMLASAAIFAVVHPPLSMLPVFGLGLCAAWAYERSKTLLAPMLVHALYNAVILYCQFYVLA